MNIKIVNKSSNALPQYETAGSAGMDIRANLEEAVLLMPRERQLIPTGLYMEIPEGYEGQLRPRSGLSIKHGVSLINCVGTVDSDYRGEIKVPVVNHGYMPYTIKHGERIAQMVISKCERAELELVESIDETERGTGGFGSTGK